MTARLLLNQVLAAGSSSRVYTVSHKIRDTKLMGVTSNLFYFFTDRFSRKFAIQLLLKIPSHLIRVATLPCKTAMRENKQHSRTNGVTNYKSQGSVATHLRCGEIFSSHIFKNLLLSQPVKKTFKIGEYVAKLQARSWIAC